MQVKDVCLTPLYSYILGQLWAMEVDPDMALEEFREIVKDAFAPDDSDEKEVKGGGAMGAMGGMMGNMGLPDFGSEISEMLSGAWETLMYQSIVLFVNRFYFTSLYVRCQ